MLENTFKDQDGTLVRTLNIFIISPRRSKVNETLQENEDDYNAQQITDEYLLKNGWFLAEQCIRQMERKIILTG